QRTPRVVQPNIDSLDEVTSHIDVVVLDEYDFVGELWVPHQLSNLLQHAFAWFIARMCLSGKDKLHRILGIVHHRCQSFDVSENQVCALIGCEATGKTDGQCIRTEHAAQCLQIFFRLSTTRRLLDCTFANEINKTRLQVEVRLPKLAVINAVNTLPGRGLAATLMPVGPEMTIVEAKHLRSDPSRHVDAVSNVPDGDFIFSFSWIQ